MSRSKATSFLCCIAFLAASLSPRVGWAQAPATAAAPDLLHQLNNAFASLFQKVAPTVVIIEADKKPVGDQQDQNFDFYFHSPEGGEGGHQHVPEPSVRSEGSGFIFRPDGYIYTNFHVIEDAEKIDVKLYDNRHFTAHVIGSDERTDVAILKIDATNLPVVSLANSDSVQVGEMCFAIGIPYDLAYSFCRGIVSGKGRGNLTSSATKPMYEDYIQTDAFINPGNSGGPLFDVDGRVMGMNTLINGLGRGLSFAIPSNMLSDVGRELITTGHVTHPWLGITVSTLGDDDASLSRFPGVNAGVCVLTIEANAPAYNSDLRPNDVITSVDGVSVQSAHDLQHEVLRKKVGQSVDLKVWRSGKTLDVSVVTDELPADLTRIAENHSKAKTAFYEMYGLELAPPHPAGQSEPVKNKLGDGVAVNGVLSDSPASRAGVQPGDLITAVGEKAVTDSVACLEELTSRTGQPRTVLSILRNGKKTRAILDTEKADHP